jgi:hypothetical protein
MPSCDMAGGMSRGSRFHTKPSHHTFTPKHCWVVNPPGAPGRWPGLLLEWRRSDDGWEGRVAYVPHLQNGHALVELWLPAQLLHAAR